MENLTELQKAYRWFNLNGIESYQANEKQLFVFIEALGKDHILLISKSEIKFRAELYDKLK